MGDDLNTKCFIHARDFDSWEALADHVMEVDQTPGLYEAYLKQPLLNKGGTAAEVVSMSVSREEKPPRSVACMVDVAGIRISWQDRMAFVALRRFEERTGSRLQCVVSLSGV